MTNVLISLSPHVQFEFRKWSQFTHTTTTSHDSSSWITANFQDRSSKYQECITWEMLLRKWVSVSFAIVRGYGVHTWNGVFYSRSQPKFYQRHYWIGGVLRDAGLWQVTCIVRERPLYLRDTPYKGSRPSDLVLPRSEWRDHTEGPPPSFAVASNGLLYEGYGHKNNTQTHTLEWMFRCSAWLFCPPCWNRQPER